MSNNSAPYLTADQIAFYEQNGYLVLENFVSASDADSMRKQASEWMEKFETSTEIPINIFSTGPDQVEQKAAYFKNSVRGIWPFFEEKAFDANHQLQVPYKQSINKIGHELHASETIFKQVTHQARCRSICEDLGVSNPTVPQSMYILKEARIGAEVSPHQDSSFLFTEPKLSCTAFWIPLEDATVENGCLWVIPKSHVTEPLRTRFVADAESAKTSFRPPLGNTWQVWPKETFTPLPARMGSLVLLHGSLVHMSLENLSEKPRHVYTWHCVSGDQAFSPENWMGTGPFTPL